MLVVADSSALLSLAACGTGGSAWSRVRPTPAISGSIWTAGFPIWIFPTSSSPARNWGAGVARVNSVRVIGSLGVLLLAKSHGLLPAVRPALEAIRAAGIHLSDSLVVETLRIAGEE